MACALPKVSTSSRAMSFRNTKIKTASTMVGLCVMLVFTGLPVLDGIVTAVIVITTLVSGIEYFVKTGMFWI